MCYVELHIRHDLKEKKKVFLEKELSEEECQDKRYESG